MPSKPKPASELPMAFSVRSMAEIQAGRKTQTRRAIDHPVPIACIEPSAIPGRWTVNGGDSVKSDFGGPGMRLWCKEHVVVNPLGRSWCIHYSDGETRSLSSLGMRSDGKPWNLREITEYSSRTMPRFAARTFLRVVDVRPEPLQSMTEAEALTEGCRDLREYRNVWDDLNEHRGPAFSWEANPYVWVITFRLDK